MSKVNGRYVLNNIKEYFEKRFARIIEINRKYSKPRIAMSPLTRMALLMLRIYLLLLVAILLYKFITIVTAK